MFGGAILRLGYWGRFCRGRKERCSGFFFYWPGIPVGGVIFPVVSASAFDGTQMVSPSGPIHRQGPCSQTTLVLSSMMTLHILIKRVRSPIAAKVTEGATHNKDAPVSSSFQPLRLPASAGQSSIPAACRTSIRENGQEILRERGPEPLSGHGQRPDIL